MTIAQSPLVNTAVISSAPDTAPDAAPVAMPVEPRAHLTNPRTRTVLGLQSRMIAAAREFLTREGITEVLPPIIGPVTDPGARGAKQVDVDYYGHRYKLMTSAILYKQTTLLTFDKIFYVAPNIRLEPLETADTARHLAEFHQIDVEVAGATREEITDLAERLVTHVTRRVLNECAQDLAALGRDRAALERACAAPFGRMSHAEAVRRLRELGHPQSPDAEIDWAGEVVLTREHDQPFFVTDYPKGSRGFYDRERPDMPDVLENFDLLAPEGYGEICSGSVRESDYARIVPRIRETGENPSKYDWYLRVLREGVPGSAGFGIGVERLTRYLAGLDAVWQASAFPKVPGVKAP
ncbi:asparagine synthetase A [Micromonospora siamensis]|uniref:Aspartate-ammonia ligase n=1 Tax=Micromonospora siamensis TaxID=299152 RepID=A0A1C5J824_9ACTN|nr:asparagine synthetase A [Micromonospora siamensis]SCG66712.1 aspartate-ammonia ligase [Micromonospora siamensis]